MKRTAIICSLFFVLTYLQAQDKEPLINFSLTNHDFGTFQEEKGPVSFEFELTNPGTAPLIINNVTATCGCTTPEWPKKPIPPGGKGTIKATYDPSNRPGSFVKTITVFSNASSTGTVLTIRGQVTPKKKKPEEIFRRKIGDLGITRIHLSFNRVLFSQIVTDSIGIYNFGEKPIDLSFERIPKYININKIPTILNPKEEGVIVITFDSNIVNDWGLVSDRIKMLVNKESFQGNELGITANVEEDFSKLSESDLLTAPQVEFTEIKKDFGIVKEGDVIEHDFVFKNNGKSDLIIRKIRSSCGCTTVSPKVNLLKPGEESSLSASFKTSGFTGRQTKSITVITNDPKRPTVVLQLSGTVNKE
jgi:hypothetical protein